MAHSRKNKPLLERLVITDVAAEGKAMGKVNDKVVFVTQTIPGDIVDVQVTKKRNNYYEGTPIRFHYYSDMRIDAFCEHFGVCGGCKWQALPYKEQLYYKQREVYNNLLRIGKVELPEISPILGSINDRFYRNKLEFTFSNKRWLTSQELEIGKESLNNNGVGFHIPGMFDKVVDVHKCHLQPEPSNAIRLAIKEFAIKHNLTFFDLRQQTGFLRTLIIRTTTIGEVMVVLVLAHDDAHVRVALFNHLVELFPNVTSWLYVINSKANDTITDQTVHVFAGRDHIFEELEKLKFKIGPKSFFQTNSQQALNLYQITREFAGLTGNETVYEIGRASCRERV